jgi:hypothetical protein
MSTFEQVPSSSPQRVPTVSIPELYEQMERNRRALDALEATTADIADLDARASRMEVSHIISFALELLVDEVLAQSYCFGDGG